MRRRRWIGGLVLIALALAVALAVRALDLERTRRFVEGELGRALGLAVHIDGEFRLDLLPRPNLHASQVTVESPPGRGTPHLLRVEELELVLALWPLVRGRVEVDRLHLRDGELRLEEDEHGRLGLAAPAADSAAPGAPLDLELRALAAHDLLVLYQASGGESWSMVIAELDGRTSLLDGRLHVDASGEMQGNSFELEARLGSLGQLLEPGPPFPVELSLRTEQAELEARGKVGDLLALRGIDVLVDARLEDLAGLSHSSMPTLGPVSFRARLHDADGPLAAEEVRLAALDAAPFRGRVSGSVADVTSFRGVALDVQVSSDDASFLAALLPGVLSNATALEIEARASDAGGTLGVDGRARASAAGGAVVLELKGSHADLSRLHGIDARLDLRARDLELLARALELEQRLPPIGPVAARGTLVGADGRLGARELEIELGTAPELVATARGSVADLAGPSGLALDVEMEVVDLAQLGRRLGRDLPSVGPLVGSAHIDDRDGSLGAERFEIRGGTQGLLSATVTGSFDDLRKLDDLVLEARIDARDLSVVGALAGLELPAVTPVEFRGSLRGSNERLQSRGTLRLDQTRASGEWSASFAPDAQPKLVARIRSDHVFLDDLGIFPRGDGVKRADGWSADTRLPLARLRDIDLDIELAAKRITGRADLASRDTLVDVDLERGILAARLHGGYEGGVLELDLDLNARGAEPRHTLQIEARNVDLTRLAAQLQESTEFAGLADADVLLTARGDTPRKLVASLGGHANLVGREGALASRWANAFVLDFARVALPTLRPSPRQPVNCFALFATLERGRVTIETLLIDAANVRVNGTGRVDLADNRYDLLLSPRALDPGLVSVAVDVEVSGPLADPKFRPVPRTIATSAARALVSNARRPADFVLRQLLGRNAADLEDACPSLPPGP